MKPALNQLFNLVYNTHLKGDLFHFLKYLKQATAVVVILPFDDSQGFTTTVVAGRHLPNILLCFMAIYAFFLLKKWE